MNLKMNLACLLISIGFVMFLNQSIYGQDETAALSLTGIPISMNDGGDKIGTSEVVRSRSLPILFSSSFLSDTLNRETKSNIKSKQFYLQKSKNQKTIAWILLGTGTAMAIGGAIILSNTVMSRHTNGSTYYNQDSGNKAKIAELVMLTGIVADLVSIPLFISASNNKKMASTLSFGNQHIYYPQNNSVCLNVHPALTLKIKF